MEWLVLASAATILLVAIIRGLMKYSEWKGGVNSDRKSFSEFIKETKGILEEIRNDIKQIFHKLDPPVAESKSPMQLTEYGEELSQKLNAQDWAERTAPTVLAKVSGKQPFEIHNFCKDFVQEFSVKTHPDVFERSYESGITDENMKIVLAIVLRDELLKQIGDQA